MTKIKQYVEHIDDELNGAKEYAEYALEFKAKNDSYWYSRFKEMSEQELTHSEYWHELAIKEIMTLKNVYTPPVKMQEQWDKSHAEYIEKSAWIRQMLAM